MVKQLSPAGELAKLSASREAKTRQAVEQGREQERRELLAGTLDIKAAERRALEDERAGIDSDFVISEGLRTGKISEVEDLINRINRGGSSDELRQNIKNRYGIVIERQPKEYKVELQEYLPIGASGPQGYPVPQQTRTYEKVLPQNYSETSASFEVQPDFTGYGEPEKRGNITVREPLKVDSKKKKGSLIIRGVAKTASQAAEMEYFGSENVEGYDFSDYRFNRSSGRAEDIRGAKNAKEAFQILGIPYTDLPKQAPQRSKSQIGTYYAGIYANPDFDTEPSTKGIQPYQGIADYTPPVVGKEDRSAQLSAEEFARGGGVLQSPLSSEKKAYYSKPRETRGEKPWVVGQNSVQGFFAEMDQNRSQDNLARQASLVPEIKSGGPNIKILETQRLDGSSERITKLKEMNREYLLKYPSAGGTSYGYRGETFDTAEQAINARQALKDQKRQQAKEIRKAQEEGLQESTIFGEINRNGLLPKGKVQTKEQTKLSEQITAEPSNIIFSGLGSQYRSSPNPKDKKTSYNLEQPEEIRSGTIGTFYGIEPQVKTQKQLKPAPFKMPFLEELGKGIGADLGAIGQKTPPKPRNEQNYFQEIGLAAQDTAGNIYADWANLPLSIGQLVQPEKTQEYESMKIPIVETSGTVGLDRAIKTAEIDALWTFGQISDSEKESRKQSALAEESAKRTVLYTESPVRAQASEVFTVAELAGAIYSGRGALKAAPYVIPKIKSGFDEIGQIITKSVKIQGGQKEQSLGEFLAGTPRQKFNLPPAVQNADSILKKGERKLTKKEADAVSKAVQKEMSKTRNENIRKEFSETIDNPSLSPETKARTEIKFLTEMKQKKENRLQNFGKLMAEKEQNPNGLEIKYAVRKFSELFPEDEKLAKYAQISSYREFNPSETKIIAGIMKNRETKETAELNRYLSQNIKRKNLADDVIGDFDERGIGSGKIFNTGKSPSGTAKLLQISETGGGTAKPKITKSGGFFAREPREYIPFVAGGSAVATGFLIEEDEKQIKKRKESQKYGIIPEIAMMQDQMQKGLFGETPAEKQKEKQNNKQRNYFVDIYGLMQEEKSGQRQVQKGRMFYYVPQKPDQIPITLNPPFLGQEPVYDKPPVEIPKLDFKQFFQRGGGGFGSEGNASGSEWMKWRVFDVAKTPFSRVNVGLGYYEDSALPNFEIKAFDLMPLGLARPKNIAEEDIGKLFGMKTRKKKR